MTGINWTPLNLTSNFNGQGNTISNYSGNSGLFNSASRTIRNLTMENCNVNANSNNPIGCIANGGGSAHNVSVSGTIINTGALCWSAGTGGIFGSGTESSITNSFVTANVTGGICAEAEHFSVSNTYTTSHPICNIVGQVNEVGSGSDILGGNNFCWSSAPSNLPTGFNQAIWRINPNVNNGFSCLIGVTPGC